MGLAASQARLLSITARLSNSEFEIQSNLNQKNRLSGTSDGITREYENSLNLKKMTMQVYDKDGSNQVDLSFRALTNYVKDSLNNPPYIVVDDKNRAVITADMLNAYQAYKNSDIDFQKYTIDDYKKMMDDAKIVFENDKKAVKDAYNALSADCIAGMVSYEVGKKNLSDAHGSGLKNSLSQVNVLLKDDSIGNTPSIETVTNKADYEKKIAQFAKSKNITTIENADEYLDLIRDYYTYLQINGTNKSDRTWTYDGGTTGETFPRTDEAHALAVLLTTGGSGPFGCDCPKGRSFFAGIDKTSNLSPEEVADYDKWQRLLSQTYGDDKLNGLDESTDEALKYDADRDGSTNNGGLNKRGDKIGGSEGAYIKAKNNYEAALIHSKYDPNLYEKIDRDGYNLNYSNDLDKTKWFQEQLRSGKLFVQRFDKQAFEGKSGYVDDSWQSGTVPVSEVADYEGRAQIKAKYDREMEKLQKIDKSFDLNIKRLESEHQALEIEYDAVKKVIEKNVESSFKTFG